MLGYSGFLGSVKARMTQGPTAQTHDRDVALAIPARPDYLVLARLALAAVCRLTPLSADDVADLKLAITEAANDYVMDADADENEGRLHFAFRLHEDRLVLELDGPSADVADVEQELGRAIIDATVDECHFGQGRTRLVKYLDDASQ
jgi:anti-sigma regulatory factor (Ser/Thr protein kinase)